MQCPYCDGLKTRRSHRRGILERVYAALSHRLPYRCLSCRGRFFADVGPKSAREGAVPERLVEQRFAA